MEDTTSRIDLTEFSEKIRELKSCIAETIVGQDIAVDLILTTILANGHVLIEGVPGVAKTLLAKLVAKLIDADFSRIQFTPDLMPSDVLGTTVFNMQKNSFDFHRGPLFGDVILDLICCTRKGFRRHLLNTIDLVLKLIVGHCDTACFGSTFARHSEPPAC